MDVQRKTADLIASIPESNRWKVDKEIDFENKQGLATVPLHLGKIAAVMTDWDGEIADHLRLTPTDRADISGKKPPLQRREALQKWKSGLGKEATYRALIQVFLQAGKVDYAECVCDLFKTGVGSATPTTASHAQTASTPTAHIDFSASMGPSDLAQWLRQEYRADYPEDVEKLCKAKINGKRLLKNISELNSKYKLDLTIGFQEEIEERVGELKASSSTAGATATPPAGGNSQANGTSTATTQAKPATTATALGITDKLSPNHLKQVLELVWDARTQYYNVGLELDLPSASIDAIERSNNYRADTIFREVINACLRQGLVTQEKLAKAVSSSQVSFAYLSDGILAEKFTPK